MRSEGPPAISPTSRQVALTVGGQLDIYDPATATLRTLGPGRHPVWSPRGDSVAYDDGSSTFVRDIDGVAATDLGPGTEPEWSTDGKTIAVRVSRQSVDLIDTATFERRPFLRESERVSTPRWSADGQWLMFIRRGPLEWWSRPEWLGYEPSQIFVRHLATGGQAPIGEIYKANPGDFMWIRSTELCAAE